MTAVPFTCVLQDEYQRNAQSHFKPALEILEDSFFFLSVLAAVYTPGVVQGTEHHAAALRDVDDAVLSLDGHPTQLDVLRVCRAHTRVLLRAHENRSSCCRTRRTVAGTVGTAFALYLQVVDEQLVEGRVGV